MNKLAALATLVRHYRLTRNNRLLHGDALRHYQDALAHRTIRYAIEKSPFYRSYFASLDVANWRNFPTIDKNIMMAHFDDFTTRGVRLDDAMKLALDGERSRNYSPSLGDLTVGLSSGTSGHRGLFLVDPRERASWAGSIMARVLPGLRRQGFRVLLFLRSGSNLYDTVGSRWLQFRFCDLMTPLAEAVKMLNEFQPDILVAPPSMLTMLAAEQTSSRLKLTPMKVISVAEVLDPVDETSIEEAFGGRVHQIYQCTEGLLAATCEAGNLHVLEDCVSLQYEPIGEDTSRVSPVVTDLWRRTQPIIRYRLNDILILESSPCPCGSGFQRIARIEGRQDDVLYFANSDGVMRPVFPDVFRRIALLASEFIRDYEIVQEQPGALCVYFAARNESVGSSADIIEHVEQALRISAKTVLEYYGCTAETIRIVHGLPHRDPHQKRRRVRRTG